MTYEDRIKKLRSVKNELLKALKLAREWISDEDKNWDVPKIIDKAIEIGKKRI